MRIGYDSGYSANRVAPHSGATVHRATPWGYGSSDRPCPLGDIARYRATPTEVRPPQVRGRAGPARGVSRGGAAGAAGAAVPLPERRHRRPGDIPPHAQVTYRVVQVTLPLPQVMYRVVQVMYHVVQVTLPLPQVTYRVVQVCLGYPGDPAPPQVMYRVVQVTYRVVQVGFGVPRCAQMCFRGAQVCLVPQVTYPSPARPPLPHYRDSPPISRQSLPSPMDMLDPGLDSAAGSAPSQEKAQEAQEGAEGEAPSVPLPERRQRRPGDPAPPPGDVPRGAGDRGSPRWPRGGAVSVVSTFGPGAPQVLQSPFSNGAGGGASPGSEGGAERLPWGGEGALLQAETTLAPATGQFYVMMTPPDVLQAGGGGAPRGLAPHGHAHGHGHAYSPKLEGPRVPRDERRRAQHNEVERRRRDKINNWIVQLSKIIPDCGADSGKSGASKGGILSKACDYVRELRQSNQRLQETFKEAERLQMDNDLLRQQLEELRSENAALRAQLQPRGPDATPERTPP
ncbi:upstream stimulatory factor 2-like [Camarhynchus parvulus]|uniref:upstream stimulatory factor 2-like n=1 Tax=Geospiza parvula TaxID=87175 RepID=UPI001237E543|nr:upstream stimulatory factor 2-like [Camarhynchus parvulus]